MATRAHISARLGRTRQRSLQLGLVVLAVATVIAGCITPTDPRGDDTGDWGAKPAPHGVIRI